MNIPTTNWIACTTLPINSSAKLTSRPSISCFNVEFPRIIPSTIFPIALYLRQRCPSISPRTLPKQFDLWSRWTANYQAGPSNGSVKSVCNLTMSMVDTCLASGCSAKKVRCKPAHTTPSVITPFDNDTFAADFFDNLLQYTWGGHF